MIIQSESGDNTTATAAASATITNVNYTVDGDDGKIKSGENTPASAAGYATITILGDYKDEFLMNIKCLATMSTWASLIKFILKDGHKGRAPSAKGLMVMLWEMLKTQGEGMNWITDARTVKSLPVFTFKIKGRY